MRIDGPGYAQRGNDALMDFYYVCTVMVPGRAGWSRPALHSALISYLLPERRP